MTERDQPSGACPGWAVFAGFLLIWQGLAMARASRFLPAPFAVARQIWILATTGSLIEDFAVTLARAGLAFCLAMALGTAGGLLLGRIRLLDRMFLNFIVVGMNLPAIVIAILCFIWLGLTDTALILAVMLNKMPLVISNIRQGVRSFDPAYDEFAAAFRLSLRDRLRLIYLPQLMPFLMTSARSGLSLIWKIVLVFEVLGADSGVGFRLSLFFEFFDMTGILAYTFVFVALVMALEHLGLGPLEQRWLAWRAHQD